MSAASGAPGPAANTPAEAKARAFLALARVAARGNLSATSRFTRLIGLSTDDRFRTAENARKLPPETVMARYAHERETHSNESTPAFVKAVFAQIEALKTRAFENVTHVMETYAAPIDLSADFERVMQEVLKIPFEASALSERQRVADELYAFLQWFREKYLRVIDGLRAERASARSILARALPAVSTLPPGFEERLATLKKTPGGARRRSRRNHRNHRNHRNRKTAHRKTRRVSRR
jgi:hypothetical protein